MYLAELNILHTGSGASHVNCYLRHQFPLISCLVLSFLQMRSSLSGMTGLNVDASILDEARINRPGAKTYEYKNAPQFGTYRCEAAPASDRRVCSRSC